MKNRKSIFIGLAILALVLTTGVFAYTYPGAATTTLDAAIAGTSYYTSNVSTGQPDWASLMPSTVPNSQVIRPVAAGDLTANSESPTTGANWDKVSDTTPDDWTTYVYSTSKFYQTDLYNLGDLPTDLPVTTNITKVTVYFRFAGSASTTGYAKAEIKTNGTIFDGAEQSQFGTIFVNSSYQWSSNPATSKQWTIADINGLQAGVSLRKEQGGYIAACTQVYVVVSYKYTITEGDVPEGHLFVITPNPSFTGDMQVRIYLTNTASVLKAYKYLNMEIYVAHSLEAAKSPPYQMLTIENGWAAFNIQGGAASSYTVEVYGGGYRLTSDNPADWGAGWSITPEFYCEVSQR